MDNWQSIAVQYMAIFTISGVKPTFGTYWCVTLPYLDRFLWIFVMYLCPTGATSGSITNLLLFFFQIWQAHIWWKSGIFIVLDFTCHYYNSYHFVLVHLEQFLFWCCYGQVSNFNAILISRFWLVSFPDWRCSKLAFRRWHFPLTNDTHFKGAIVLGYWR